jgi:hypothetical protein
MAFFVGLLLCIGLLGWLDSRLPWRDAGHDVKP